MSSGFLSKELTRNMRRFCACIVLPFTSMGLQDVVAQRPSRSALLPDDHWSVTALRRIEARTPYNAGSEFAGNTFSQTEVALRLRLAAQRLAGDSLWEIRARNYLARYEEEFPGVRNPPAGVTRISAMAAAGMVSATGRAAPGNGWFRDEDWTGAQPLDDLQSAIGAAALSLSFGRHAALQLAGAFDGAQETLLGSQAVLGGWGMELWAGRRQLQLGPGAFGVVLGGYAELDAVGFQLRPAVRLPWVLRYLGPVRFETLLSPMARNGRVEDPWFWAARGSIQPLRTLTLGINRGSIFGGDGNPVRLVDVLEMLAGGYGGDDGEFENQVVSLDARWTVPARLPLEFYVEIGSDDGAGMWHRSPGVIAGWSLLALPGLPDAFATLEGSLFPAKTINKNTYWYRNVYFRGSWSKDNAPLGHPLGGHGSEIALSLGADLHAARVRLRSRLYTRERGEENIYAPERAGLSRGAALSLNWRVRRVEAALAGELEDGDGWSSRGLSLTLRSFF